jgi:hypothetical protein
VKRKNLALAGTMAALLIPTIIHAQTRKTPAPIVDGSDYLASKSQQNQGQGQNAGQDGSPAPTATPGTHTVIAIGLGQTVPGLGRPVPGAVVCGDIATVEGVVQWFFNHWSDSMQDAMTNGQSQLLRESTQSPAPYLKSLGCTVVPEGTSTVTA